jgi:large subunit ribosomal protein L15
MNIETEDRVMKLHEIADNPGARKNRFRIGRGIGSGKGKTGGRGGKGQTARSGVRIKGFEGGQMPLHRRLPKRGFRNTAFAPRYNEINLGKLQAAIDAGTLDSKATIDVAALVKAGVLRRPKAGVRLLGTGELKAKIDIVVAGASKSAQAAVEKAGGSVKVLTPKKEEPEEPRGKNARVALGKSATKGKGKKKGGGEGDKAESKNAE